MAAPLKPPARAHRALALRRRGEQAVLTTQAIDALFRTASVLAEGELGGEPDAPRWYGSILVTFDLARLVASCRGLEEPSALECFVSAVEGSVRVRIQAHRVARGALLERHPDRDVGTVHLESRFRREGDLLLLDIDLEAPIGVASRSRRAR